MANRTRNIVLRVPVTPEERALIQQKMAQLHTKNFSAYARKMLIDGYVTKDDAGHRIQHIRIYYNFLGDVEIPDEWLDDEQDAGAPDENEQEETA